VNLSMEAADLQVGELLAGRYRVGPVIGHGGMAQVYRGVDLVLDRPVAVKVFHATAVEYAATARQAGEARILAGLDHRNLVRVFDADTDPGTGCSFLVMELVEGASVSAVLAGCGPMPPDAVAAIGAQLGEAVAAVHRAGIVHRDIKPANVLLTHPIPDAAAQSGTAQVRSDDDATGQGAAGGVAVARLTDFGIARFLEATRLTTTGLLIGTAQYLSPEQTLGEPVGYPSDVYALGLLLLECLTGQVEFPGSPVESAVARLHRHPVIPAELGSGWAALLGSMTAREPDQRPTAADAAALLRNLGGAAVGGTATLPVGSPPAATTPTDDRGRRSDTAAHTTAARTTAQRHRVHRVGVGRQGESSGATVRSGTAVQRRSSARRWGAAAAVAAAALLTVAALNHPTSTSTPAAHRNGGGSPPSAAASAAGVGTSAGGRTASGIGASASGTTGSSALGAGPSRSGHSRSATALHRRSPGSRAHTSARAPVSARPAARAAAGTAAAAPSAAAQQTASPAARTAPGATSPAAGAAASTTYPAPPGTATTTAAHTPTPTSTATATSTGTATSTATTSTGTTSTSPATGSPSSSTSHGQSAAHKPVKHHGNPHHR